MRLYSDICYRELQVFIFITDLGLGLGLQLGVRLGLSKAQCLVHGGLV